jgi:hypothetical protein
LRKIRDRMLTKEGRRLAEARHSFMEDFFKWIQIDDHHIYRHTGGPL